MGLRKIDDEISLKEAMKKKGAELRLKEMQAKASVENLTKERLKQMAKEHGVLLALNPELKEQVKYLQEKFNIPSSKIITEQIDEEDVLSKMFSRIDHEKLGMLAYQRVLMRKEEIGVGLVPLSEIYDLVNTGELKGEVDIKDVKKAMEKLLDNNVIEDIKELDSGAIMVQFFPIEYTEDQVKVIDLAKEKGFLSLEEVCTNLGWTQDRALRALKSLENSGLAKFRESILKGKQWFFPSI
jgi:transcription initiation factor IIE alpha subunit